MKFICLMKTPFLEAVQFCRRAAEAEEKRSREERLRRAEEVRAKRKQEEARKKVRRSSVPAWGVREHQACSSAPRSARERRNNSTVQTPEPGVQSVVITPAMSKPKAGRSNGAPADAAPLHWPASTYTYIYSHKLVHPQAEEEAAWAAAQKEAETRRLAEEERRRKAERTVRRAPGTPAAER